MHPMTGFQINNPIMRLRLAQLLDKNRQTLLSFTRIFHSYQQIPSSSTGVLLALQSGKFTLQRLLPRTVSKNTMISEISCIALTRTNLPGRTSTSEVQETEAGHISELNARFRLLLPHAYQISLCFLSNSFVIRLRQQLQLRWLEKHRMRCQRLSAEQLQSGIGFNRHAGSHIRRDAAQRIYHTFSWYRS